MSNMWDSDRKLLALVLVAAAVSLGITNKSVLARTADGVIQKVEGTLHQFTGESPSQAKKASRAAGQRGRFTSMHRTRSVPEGNGCGTPMRYVVLGWHSVRRTTDCRPGP